MRRVIFRCSVTIVHQDQPDATLSRLNAAVLPAALRMMASPPAIDGLMKVVGH
jgi:hypothetical protein